MPAGRVRVADPGAAPIARRAWAILAVCSATVFLTLLDSGSLFIAFPFIEDRFGDTASRATLSWTVTGFFIVMVSVLLVAGRCADRFGRRRVFLTGLAVYAAAAVAAGSTGSVTVLIVARCLQGLGVGLLSPSSISLALPAFPVERRAFALGVWGSIGAASGLLSSPLGAVLVDIWSWRATFYFNATVALVVLAVAARVLDDSGVTSDRRPIDGLGAVLATIAVAGLAITLVQGDEWGWSSTPTRVAMIAAVVAAPAFWVRNSVARSPLLDASVFRSRRFAVASVASVSAQLGFFAIYFGMPLFMEEAWGWSPLQIGLGLLPLHAPAILTSALAGRIVDRQGPRVMIAFGGVLTAVCYLALALWVVDLGYSAVAVMLLISGVGTMAIGNTTTIAALRGIDDEVLGAANAAYFLTRRLGSAMGAVATAAILGNSTGADFRDAFVWVWVFGATVYLIGGLVVWFFYPAGREPTPTSVS